MMMDTPTDKVSGRRNNLFRDARRRLRSPSGTVLSTRELADVVNVCLAEKHPSEPWIDRSYIGKIERGVIRWPGAVRRTVFRHILNARTDADLGFRPVKGADAPDVEPVLSDSNALSVAPPPYTAAESTGIHNSFGGLPSSNLTEATLAYLEASTAAAIVDSERVSPVDLQSQVGALHHYVEYLLHGHQHPPQRARLYAVNVYLSGLLGILYLDSGQRTPAQAYTQYAYRVADAAQQPDLQSWARATQSLVAYYAGDYRTALELARDGQRAARGGVHSIRLAINGEARALARLGDHYGVDNAVERAFQLLDAYPAGESVSPSLTLGAYCHARSAANAATAYLLLAKPTQVDTFIQVAINAFDSAGLHGPQALSRLDLATALLLPGGDLDRACGVATEALTVSTTDTFESVALRAAEFVGAAQPWRTSPAVRQVRELVSSYRSVRTRHPLALASVDVDDRADQP